MKMTTAIAILLACFSAAQFAGSAPITVSSLHDSGPGTLRQAIPACPNGRTIATRPVQLS